MGYHSDSVPINIEEKVEFLALDVGSSKRGDNHIIPRSDSKLHVEKIKSKMAKELETLDKEFFRESAPNIFRVPEAIRNVDPVAYDPKIVSIGPYHHGKEKLRHFEKIKYFFLEALLERSSGVEKEQQLHTYIKIVASYEATARKRYSEEINMSSEEFVQMLVLDGCFLLEVFFQRRLEMIMKPLASSRLTLPYLLHDFLLLENQIPFFILETLFANYTDICVDHQNHDLPTPAQLVDHAVNFITDGSGKVSSSFSSTQEVHHLLHLSYLCFYTVNQHSNNTWQNDMNRVLRIIPRVVWNISSFFFFGFLYAIMSLFTCNWRWHHLFKKKKKRAPRNIPTATELLDVGVEFKMKAQGPLDLSFNHGTMEMGRLSINMDTNSNFRNLLAFEQCFPSVENKFTSYLVFMDNLVNTADDVGVLRRNGILETKLGSDEEAADLFNKIGSGACLNFEDHTFKDVFKDVTNYFERDHNVWRARLMNDYLANPWTILSLAAVWSILILTLIQTIYTIKSYKTN